jgi:spore germination cell wall hydrolase CwlJ-like protein
MSYLNQSEIEILARTIYGEARGEYGRLDGGISSLLAVGNVVMNRVKQQTWYGTTVKEVCLKPWQFSCWNPNDPNLPLLTQPLGGRVFGACLQVAEKVIRGEWPDLTGGCDHYHAASLKKFPRWTLEAKPRFRVGQHVFYDLRK